MTEASYTIEEVKKHNKDNDLWIVVDGNVYDVTDFRKEHPGGDAILDGAGKDATEMFESVGHSSGARDEMANWKIGKLSK